MDSLGDMLYLAGQVTFSAIIFVFLLIAALGIFDRIIRHHPQTLEITLSFFSAFWLFDKFSAVIW